MWIPLYYTENVPVGTLVLLRSWHEGGRLDVVVCYSRRAGSSMGLLLFVLLQYAFLRRMHGGCTVFDILWGDIPECWLKHSTSCRDGDAAVNTV